jgi:hypothetical protein
MNRRRVAYDLVVLARRPRTLRQWPGIAALLNVGKRCLPYGLRDPDTLAVGGHYGVTRSLISGLRAIGANFCYEPNLDRTFARAAIVLGPPESLPAAIDWKRRGGVELLLAGPNVVDDPRNAGGVLLTPEIDRAVVASDKMRVLFESLAPSLSGRMRVWPAGVDEQYWQPSSRNRRDGILIYDKRMPRLAAELRCALSARGHRCETIRYGEKRWEKYPQRQFRAALDRSRICVFLSYDEPQGLAAAEAWSMDVPTFAYRAEKVRDVATVPYLTAATGCYWSSVDEVLALVEARTAAEFDPRGWVLKNMTDAICAEQLISLALQP